MTTPQPLTMGRLEWLLLLTLSGLWGGSFIFNEVLLEQLQPLTIVLGRVGLAAFALNLLVVARGLRMPRSGHAWLPFLIMGAINNMIPFSLIVWGQTRIGSSLAAILNATTPLFTVLVAHLLTRDERLTPRRLGGALLGFAGVIVLIGPGVLRGIDGQIVAQLAVVGAALSYAFAGVFGRRFRHSPPMITAAGQLTGSVLLMIPLALIVDRPWTEPVPEVKTWVAWLSLALLSSALAYVIYFRILATAGASNVILVTLLVPVSATVLALAFLGESIRRLEITGMALIALGLAVTDGRLLRALQSRFRRRIDAATTPYAIVECRTENRSES